MQPRTVRPRANEVEPVRSAMRDVQVSITDYYRGTTGFVEDAEQFTTPVRATVAFIQKVHEVLRKDFGQSDRYRQVFATRLAGGDPGAETIEGLRYLRNVGQHLIHPVVPDTSRVVGSNMGLGFRTSALWAPIPPAVHRSLHTTTQPLQVHYNSRLLGRDVLDTFLDAARFFWEVCPKAIHRAAGGEWTGFPLRHQAGVATRLHPEEPKWDSMNRRDWDRARRWMDTRRPGGDFRVICGRLTTEAGTLLVGCTFRGHASFQGFAETPDQVAADIALGYPNHAADPIGHVEPQIGTWDRGGEFTPYFLSSAPVADWIGEPIAAAPEGRGFVSFQDRDSWQHIADLSLSSRLDRRNQRLGAWFPIR